MTTFDLDPDTLHELVNDVDKGKKHLEELGGVAAVAAKLRTNLSRGLEGETIKKDSKERQIREEKYGVNELPEAEEVTFMDLVWESLEDRMMQILIVSAVISLTLGLTVPDQHTGQVDYAHGWIEGAAILISVTLVTVVSSLNNYQKELKFKELTKATPPVEVSVIRNGKTIEVTDKELLVGDLLNIAGGDVLTVDGIVLRSSSLKVDESAATGENDDITKSSRGDCFVRSGSNVVEGEATILITGVGVHSFAGRIAMQVREAKEETPLQEKLTVLADQIGLFGMVAAGLMFTILSAMELYYTFIKHSRPFYYKKYLDNLTTAVTIVVVAVPEGLPLSVTIALAYSMKEMFKENNLVRHLAACETMGGATTICTDKTGTITQNKMSVTDGVTGSGQAFYVPVADHDGTVNSPTSKEKNSFHFSTLFDKKNKNHAANLRALLFESISINTKSSRKRIEVPKTHQSAVVLTGNKTEQALLLFVDRCGEDPIALRQNVLEKVQDASNSVPESPYTSVMSSWPSSSPEAAATFSKEMHVYPFTSARKRMTTAIAFKEEQLIRYHVKGASETILSECTHCVDEEGERKPLERQARASFEDHIFSFAKRRLRTLAIAYAEIPIEGASAGKPGDLFLSSDEKLPGLTLLAIVAIRDPVRPEVPHAIQQCKEAGVMVRMITGDNRATAISIAKEVGIYGPVWHGPFAGQQGLALEGPLFREFAKSERKLNEILPKLQVISRASPLDKQILVSALMKRGEVVAVTGDGTNDAPALKNANVGFSMNSGTEVAKNASDVVILDDNFNTIVTATKWGRNVRDNISKFLQFQMTVNVAAVVVSFVGALFDEGGESPLKPVQLLWLNLIMDTLAALALATETPTDELLQRHPQPKNAPLISARMWTNILGQSLYQVVLQLWLLNSGYSYFGVEKNSETHLTVVFNVFVLLQLCNEFNARILDQSFSILKGINHAPMFVLVVLSTFVIQIFGVQYGGPLMQTVPLTRNLWRKCFFVSFGPLPLGILLRMLPVKEFPIPPPEKVVDPKEEEEILERTLRLPAHSSFRDVARRVLLQVRVIKAFKLAKQKRQ